MLNNRGASKIKLVLGIAAAIGILFVLKMLPFQEYLNAATKWIESLGTAGVFAFIGIYVAAAVFLVSGAALTLGAGAIFGVVKGSIYVSIASTLGATVAFLVGRYLARGWVAKKTEGNKKFKAIDEAVGKEGWKIVGLTRLSPIFPYTLLNYMYGLTKVKLIDFVLASWIGMMPGTIMYVYLGSAGGEALKATAGAGGRTPQEWALFVVGLVATVVVTVFVTKVAKKALNEKVAEG